MKNKIKIIKTALLALAVVGAGLCLSQKAQAADWYSPDWSYRKTITVDNASSAALADYQVLITLNAGNFDYGKANGDGSDLRFISSDGLTEISYWIKEWTSGGDSKIWVKVPSIPASSAATVYLYYGNPGITGSTGSFDAAMQKLGTDSSTAALWHFDEGEGTTIGDSSINANNGTMVNFPTDGSAWTADPAFSSGSALNFDGVDDYIEAPHSDSFNFGTENFTIEGWVNIREAIGNGNILEKYDWTNTEKEIGLILDINNYGVNLVLWDEDREILIDAASDDDNGDIAPNQWAYIAVVRDGLTSVHTYINGEDKTKIVNASGIQEPVDNIESLKIGKQGLTAPFDGLIDELRISDRALSAQEIKADYERRQYAAAEPASSLGIEEMDPYNTSQIITAAEGGTVTNEAGTVAVNIPAGALAANAEITVEAAEASGDFQIQNLEPIEYVYTFGPEGTVFSHPVTLTFSYDDAGMTLDEEQNMDIYLYNETAQRWEAQGATVDTNLNTLALSVSHFSKFAVGRNVVLKAINKLALSVDQFYAEGKIGNQGVAQSLLIELRNSQREIRAENTAIAIKMLENFAARVEQHSPKLIEPSAAGTLIGKANEIITDLR